MKIGIIICDRWRRCAGGKCLRALEERQGAFSRYESEDVQLAGYTTCDGCPGGTSSTHLPRCRRTASR